VLVHGAFADASGWSAVIERLSAAGYLAYAPDECETLLTAGALDGASNDLGEHLIVRPCPGMPDGDLLLAAVEGSAWRHAANQLTSARDRKAL
jgi:hypothetical protein